jgi:hypothetical protein
MKTRVTCKEQRIADLEHWITSGHHLTANINELVVEFRNKSKWRLQLNNTGDLRAITVYLWKIVNVQGFALFDKHIPSNPSLHRQSAVKAAARRVTLVPSSTPSGKSNSNPYQTIDELCKNNVRHPTTTTTTLPGASSSEPLHASPRTTSTARTTTAAGPSHVGNASEHGQSVNFSADLEQLKCLFDFPEEVAIRLTEIEHSTFLSVPPLQYLRHLTLDMSLLPSADTSGQTRSIQILVERFQAVDR